MNEILLAALFLIGIIQIVLFFKIWGATNDIGEIKEKYKFGSTDKRHIMKAVLINNKQAILELVCDSFINEVLRINKAAMSESKFEKAMQDTIAKHERLLRKYDIDVPDFSIYANKKKIEYPL